MECENEVWETYPEFNFIQDSNLGRIRTVDRYVKSKQDSKRLVKGRVLKQQLRKDGRLEVCFSVNGKGVHRQVHRVVARTFIPNPNNWPEINHKDCDPKNNRAENLEWCTHEQNINYREKYGTSAAEALGRPLFAISLETQETLQFESQHEASRQLNIDPSNIGKVARGGHQQTRGYWFTHADENAVEKTRTKFGDEVANRVAKLMEW